MNLRNGVLLFYVSLMMSCTSQGGLPPAEVYAVQWFPGFAMTDMLAKKAPVHDQHEVQALLDKPWDFSYKLTNLRTHQVFNADRCRQILPDITQLETYRPYEFRTYIYLAAMCIATESIAKARPAKFSALSTFKLDADLPRQLPKNLAFLISGSEKQSILQNKKIVTWAQAEPVKFVSKDGEYKAKYATTDAYQELSIIARGDFNDDGIEDILLLAEGFVVGGSYTADRLFWITRVTATSPITIFREYSRAY